MEAFPMTNIWFALEDATCTLEKNSLIGYSILQLLGLAGL